MLKKDIYWWPDKTSKPKIKINNAVRAALFREACASNKEGLERMVVLVGRVRDGVFCARRMLDHDLCAAGGLVVHRSGYEMWVRLRSKKAMQSVSAALQESEVAVIGHTHPSAWLDLSLHRPSSGDRETSSQDQVAGIVFGCFDLILVKQLWASGYAGRYDIPVYHNGRKLGGLF